MVCQAAGFAWGRFEDQIQRDRHNGLAARQSQANIIVSQNVHPVLCKMAVAIYNLYSMRNEKVLYM